MGLCVRCRAEVCSECSTKVDGINHCVACLRELARDRAARPAREGSGTGSRVLAVGSAVGMFVLLSLMTWALLEVALPGAG